MKRCPRCGRYMTWYMVLTKGYWKCVCGYDTRSITYTFSDRTEKEKQIDGSIYQGNEKAERLQCVLS